MSEKLNHVIMPKAATPLGGHTGLGLQNKVSTPGQDPPTRESHKGGTYTYTQNMSLPFVSPASTGMH